MATLEEELGELLRYALPDERALIELCREIERRLAEPQADVPPLPRSRPGSGVVARQIAAWALGREAVLEGLLEALLSRASARGRPEIIRRIARVRAMGQQPPHDEGSYGGVPKSAAGELPGAAPRSWPTSPAPPNLPDQQQPRSPEVGSNRGGAVGRAETTTGRAPAPPGVRALETRVVPRQEVSIGIADPAEPETAMSIDRTLAAGTRHLLWVQISEQLAPGSAPSVAALTDVRAGDELDVVVFGFPKQLELEGPRHGRIRLGSEGNVLEKRAWDEILPDSRLPRLYFAFTTPAAPGRYALRCNIYCRGLLLQSHLVGVQVAVRPAPHQGAVDRLLDYNLTSKLDPRCLSADGACKLSIFLNDDSNGTHSLRFVASDNGAVEVIADAHLEGVQLQKMVDYARQALRWTAWGTTDPWKGEACKFTGGFDRKELGTALVFLARRGANLWMQLAERFAFFGSGAVALSERMRAPGRVQVALKQSPEAVIPAALVYDYPFDVATADVELCEASLGAIAAGRPLDQEPCFRGQCPSHGDLGVVCASGFWGFRHEIGLPLHLPRGEVASKISTSGSVRAFAPISTDESFVIRDRHLDGLASLSPSWLEVLRSREDCLARLKEARQIVYFYCHGGVKEETNTPFLQVGAVNSEPIFAQSLFTAQIYWEEPVRPLVILNGCHTTATSPDTMFSMLTGFAAHCNAAGIIGTEITNFEFVSSAFGDAFLRRFLRRESVGSAVRMARLDLLRQGSPLGLMYIPFALPSLCLE